MKTGDDFMRMSTWVLLVVEISLFRGDLRIRPYLGGGLGGGKSREETSGISPYLGRYLFCNKSHSAGI